ncbi:MAG: hypothetical protein KDK76_07295 [Chlamydiia bacterium]|nr:hypothetical protein [Chlamydiia bacterium]
MSELIFFGKAVRFGACFIGGVYMGDFICRKGQSQNARVQKVTLPIIKKFEEASVSSLLIGTPFLVVITHTTLALFIKMKKASPILMKPLSALEGALGTYTFSIPFLQGTVVTIHSRKDLPGDGRLPLQMVRHLARLLAYELFGRLVNDIEAVYSKVQQTYENLENMKEQLAEEAQGFYEGLEIALNINQPESLNEILANAKEFSETLLTWQGKIKEFEEKLHDYVSVAHARKESLEECDIDAIEARVNEVLNRDPIGEGNLDWILSLCLEGEITAERLREKVQEIKRLKNDIEHLFLKAEHLIQGVEILGGVNDTEVLSFVSWELTSANMNLSSSQLFVCHFMDQVRGLSSRGEYRRRSNQVTLENTLRNQNHADPQKRQQLEASLSKEGVIYSTANDQSHFTAGKRKALESADRPNWNRFAQLLVDIHALRKSITSQLNVIHNQNLLVQKPFFEREIGQASQMRQTYQEIDEAFQRLRKPIEERCNQISWERKLENISATLAAPYTVPRHYLSKLGSYFSGSTN